MLRPSAPIGRSRAAALSALFIVSTLFLLSLFTAAASAARTVIAVAPVDEAQTQQQHRTALYRTSQYYLWRRGGDVKLRVQLDSPLDGGQTLTMQIAPTSILDAASIRVAHVQGALYEILARVDVNAPVGTSAVSVRLSDGAGAVASMPKQAAVLFNPWHAGDATHYPNVNELEEYIDNEHGVTYRGTRNNVQSVRWYFGQFSHESLLVALYQLNKLDANARRDPNSVARHFTAVMTPQPAHPDGILEGRWDRVYPGGMNPSAWQGSDAILRHYVAQGFNTVKYGQCWVFGGVLTTLLRAIGIPARSVSNYDSFHETPVATDTYNQEMLRYWDRNSRRLVAEIGMIWNFHSWVSAWFKNNVAPAPYDTHGWNELDGTPQEPSEGKYQLGPASLRAVRDMRKDVPYDVSFVMSEVSARVHNYRVACPFIPWGKLNQLPESCVITEDMGVEAQIPTGTILATKNVGMQAWGANTVTSLYHTRGGPAANAGPVFTSSAPGTVYNPVMAPGGNFGPVAGMRWGGGGGFGGGFSGFNNGGFRTFTVDGDGDGAGAGAGVPADTSFFHFSSSGVGMSVAIPPVRLGEDITIWVNFACKTAGAGAGAGAGVRRRLAMRGGGDTERVELFSAADDDDAGAAAGYDTNDDGDGEGQHGYHEDVETDTRCPDTLPLSLTLSLSFADYTNNEHAPIGEHTRTVTLRPQQQDSNGYNNGYIFASLEFSAGDDYLERVDLPVSDYVKATVVATPVAGAGAGAGAATPMVASSSMALLPPLLEVHANNTRITSTSTSTSITLRFTNPFETRALTDVRLTLSADHLGFEEKVVVVNNVAPGGVLLYVHDFDARAAEPGQHFYHAVLTTGELQPVVGEVPFVVDAGVAGAGAGAGAGDKETKDEL